MSGNTALRRGVLRVNTVPVSCQRISVFSPQAFLRAFGKDVAPNEEADGTDLAWTVRAARFNLPGASGLVISR